MKFKFFYKKINMSKRIFTWLLSIVLAFAMIVSAASVISCSKGDIAVAVEQEYTRSLAYAANTDREMRGVWIASVANINFPSKTGLSAAEMKAELDDIVKNCKEANLNAIFFQVRPTADALYDSAYFPTSRFLTGTQGDRFQDGFDPLKYIIQIAHENDIELHAWINPYRITNGTADKPQTDLNSLAVNHPARRFPELVVKYADGKMYFNPGLPEVQKLITNGVIEIIKKYDVDGIHFDDYFYPYPVNTTVDGKSVRVPFDDAAAYKKYGGEYKTVEDFRRASVNAMIKKVYLEIKAINPNIRFGISPFGIWANKSNSTPTGSDTSGFEAYHSLYADARAWVAGGYVDYLCPQIYWSFASKAAPYDVLVRWWSALLDGTSVDLYIGHAAYKLETEFQNEHEIPQQVEFARSYMSVKGSVFYGYKDIAANSYNIKTHLKRLFAEERAVSKPVSTGASIVIGRPANETNVSEANINIMGGSDPAYPVYYDNQKVTRTKSGFFSVFVPLKSGRNDIVFTQNDVNTTHTVYRGGKPANTAPYVYPKMDSYKIQLVSPASNTIMEFPGGEVQIRVQAPSKSTVTAQLSGTKINLTPLTAPPDEAAYMTEVYSGTIKISNAHQPNGTIIDLGNINFAAVRGNENAELTGPNVKVIDKTIYNKPCEVINDNAYIYRGIPGHQVPGQAGSVWNFYNGYSPASVGMRDYITGYWDGYYELRFGGYVHFSNVKMLYGQSLANNKINSATIQNSGVTTDIIFAATENVPVDARCKDGVFTVTLFNTPSDGVAGMNHVRNPIFSSVRSTYDANKKVAVYTFDLIDADNFYGYELSYEGGNIIIRVKNPRRKAEGDKPLEGLNIIVDAGHGGSETGALGFLGRQGKNEKDLNLEISLALKEKLISLGANVLMIRETDETVDINSRMDTLNEVNPDLCISVHHNSLVDTRDLALVRGILVLYCDDSGRSLSKSVSASTAFELNRFERSVRHQSLAMLRNHKFPATLIEMSFITSPEEYESAIKPSNVQKSADGIAKGVIAWLDNQAKFIIEE